MATVNFSVPDDVKQEFNELFSSENKSAVLTALMREAIAGKLRCTAAAGSAVTVK